MHKHTWAIKMIQIQSQILIDVHYEFKVMSGMITTELKVLNISKPFFKIS